MIKQPILLILILIAPFLLIWGAYRTVNAPLQLYSADAPTEQWHLSIYSTEPWWIKGCSTVTIYTKSVDGWFKNQSLQQEVCNEGQVADISVVWIENTAEITLSGNDSPAQTYQLFK